MSDPIVTPVINARYREVLTVIDTEDMGVALKELTNEAGMVVARVTPEDYVLLFEELPVDPLVDPPVGAPIESPVEEPSVSLEEPPVEEPIVEEPPMEELPALEAELPPSEELIDPLPDEPDAELVAPPPTVGPITL